MRDYLSNGAECYKSPTNRSAMTETPNERFDRLIAEYGQALRRLTTAYEFNVTERDARVTTLGDHLTD